MINSIAQITGTIWTKAALYSFKQMQTIQTKYQIVTTFAARTNNAQL